MATYTVTEKYLLDNYAVLQLLTPSEIAVGQSIVVASVDATFNGTVSVVALPQYLYIGTDTQGDLLLDYNEPMQNQVLYAKTAANIARVAASGTVTYTPTCTWSTYNQALNYLGIPVASADDETYITRCVSAGNQYAYRRRQESGYIDSLTVHPSDDVLLGTIMYVSALYRQRGSVDAFSSFNDMGSQAPVALSGIVKQLLGIPRPAVA